VLAGLVRTVAVETGGVSAALWLLKRAGWLAVHGVAASRARRVRGGPRGASPVAGRAEKD